MGQITANISIYIPAAGETNYDASFAAGMINIDQHDHSGGPNKGLPISGSGIDAGAITFDKLNADVADNATGIGTAGSLGANQLSILGLLKNIYQIATTNGYIVKNGSNAAARTLTGTSAQITITNGDGTTGNPVFSLPSVLTAPGSIAATTSITAGTTITATLGDITATNGNLVASTAGKTIQISSAANGCVGSATLVNGVVVVATTAFNAGNTFVLTTRTTKNTSTAFGNLYVSSFSNNVSFTITSGKDDTTTETNDQSTFEWFLIKT